MILKSLFHINILMRTDIIYIYSFTLIQDQLFFKIIYYFLI